MFQSSKPFLTLAFTCSLLLAGCETSTPVKKTDVQPAHAAKDGAVQKPAELTKEISNADMSGDKIAALQQQVTALQQEVIAARPKLAKIDVMEQKFKDLSLGLDRIDATYGMQKNAPAAVPVPAAIAIPVPPPVAPVAISSAPEKPVPVVEAKPPAPPKAAEKPAEKEAEKPVAKTEAAPVGKPVVKDVRIGEQKGFSRLVLDLGKEAKVTYDVDNDEKILLIDIPGFTWEGAKTKTIANSPLVASYQASSDDKGAHLVVQLKNPAKVSNYTSIGPVGGKFPRAVLDISPQ